MTPPPRTTSSIRRETLLVKMTLRQRNIVYVFGSNSHWKWNKRKPSSTVYDTKYVWLLLLLSWCELYHRHRYRYTRNEIKVDEIKTMIFSTETKSISRMRTMSRIATGNRKMEWGNEVEEIRWRKGEDARGVLCAHSLYTRVLMWCEKQMKIMCYIIIIKTVCAWVWIWERRCAMPETADVTNDQIKFIATLPPAFHWNWFQNTCIAMPYRNVLCTGHRRDIHSQYISSTSTTYSKGMSIIHRMCVWMCV